jgi:nickel transport protein
LNRKTLKNRSETFFFRGIGPICLLVFLLVLGWSNLALAHKVYVFAWAEKGKVYTESSFGDRRVNKGKIKVEDKAGTVITTGITDDQGNFSFTIPSGVSSDLVVKLDASMGHQASWTLALKEIQVAMDPGDSEKNHARAMAKKEELEQGPSFVRISAGIGIIFALAFLGSKVHGRLIRRRTKRRKDD